MMHFLPLILIPICALLNHLAGQSTAIPDVRIICRVFGITAAFGIVAYLSGLPIENLSYATGSVLAGIALWSIPGWASGFVCIPLYNDTRQQTALSSVVNWIMGVSYLDRLTPSQCHWWGMIYFTLRGMYLYPAFAGLGYFLTPWAFLIGLGSGLQGIVYGTSSFVLYAEYKMGGIIGIMLCVILCLSCY